MDQEKLLVKVSQVRLKAPKLDDFQGFIFLEVLILENQYFTVETTVGMVLEKTKISISK